MDYEQLSKEYFPVVREPGLLLSEAGLDKAPKQLRHWWAEGGKLHESTRHRVPQGHAT